MHIQTAFFENYLIGSHKTLPTVLGVAKTQTLNTSTLVFRSKKFLKINKRAP